MLAKCINPACTAVFRYLHEGRLFRLEADPDPTSQHNWNSPGLKPGEFYWLCGACSTLMTLHLADDGAVVAARLPGCIANCETFLSLHEQKGFSLRCVNFL